MYITKDEKTRPGGIGSGPRSRCISLATRKRITVPGSILLQNQSFYGSVRAAGGNQPATGSAGMGGEICGTGGRSNFGGKAKGQGGLSLAGIRAFCGHRSFCNFLSPFFAV